MDDQELFVNIEGNLYKLDPVIVRKYNLKKGSRTPMTGYPIVDAAGDGYKKPQEDQEKKAFHNPKEDSDPESLDNGMVLSTAEMIDISQGADSEI